MASIMSLVALACLAVAVNGAILPPPENAHSPAAKETYYFPCKRDFNVKYNTAYDILRGQGEWFATSQTLPISAYHFRPEEIQAHIDKYIGCAKASNVLSDPVHRNLTVDAHVVLRQPLDDVAIERQLKEFNILKGLGDLSKKTHYDVRYQMHPDKVGDNGHWLAVFESKKATFLMDVYIISTDYTTYAMTYTCADVKVKQGFDVRLDQLSLATRKPEPLPLKTQQWLRFAAKLAGVATPDPMFNIKQDLC